MEFVLVESAEPGGKLGIRRDSIVEPNDQLRIEPLPGLGAGSASQQFQQAVSPSHRLIIGTLRSRHDRVKPGVDVGKNAETPAAI
jgi:hypothetical protein